MKELSTTFDYYILPNKIFCTIVGIWPIGERSSTCSKIFAYFRLIVSLIAISNFFVPEIMAVAFYWGDVETVIGIGSNLMSATQLFFKMIYLVARRERVYRLYNEIRILWDSTDDPNERKSYEQIAYRARIVTITFSSCFLCNLTTFSIATIADYFRFAYNGNNTNDNRHLPFLVWYGTDISASPKFEIAFVGQVMTAMIGLSAITAIDCTFMTMILHVSGQFILIKTWINKIGFEMNHKSIDMDKFEEDLFKCIRHHQRMIHVVNDVNNLLTPIIFMQLLTSGLEICLSGYAMLDNGTKITDILKFTSYFISVTVQLLLWCWPGEILVQESQEVGQVVYFSVPWYNLPPIYRNHVCLMIIRAQQYCSITALTFKVLSIQTLTAVFNTAISYFTVLQQMQQN
ncbi:odorant receptor 67c-like [Bombus bifarius]|uniref:Odorant receptor n=1 Tax=Bombus bifarius TaxID=103933 RepID=A0A6P8NH54_9HYME|nr:odorant receptor 67c-like [Bombus bifarius]